MATPINPEDYDHPDGIEAAFDQIGAPRILTLRKDGVAVYIERDAAGNLVEMDPPEPEPAPDESPK